MIHKNRQNASHFLDMTFHPILQRQNSYLYRASKCTNFKKKDGFSIKFYGEMDEDSIIILMKKCEKI